MRLNREENLFEPPINPPDEPEMLVKCEDCDNCYIYNGYGIRLGFCIEYREFVEGCDLDEECCCDNFKDI